MLRADYDLTMEKERALMDEDRARRNADTEKFMSRKTREMNMKALMQPVKSELPSPFASTAAVPASAGAAVGAADQVSSYLSDQNVTAGKGTEAKQAVNLSESRPVDRTKHGKVIDADVVSPTTSAQAAAATMAAAKAANANANSFGTALMGFDVLDGLDERLEIVEETLLHVEDEVRVRVRVHG